MAILPNLRNLLIPGKSSRKAHPEYKTDMQQLEIWARQPVQQLVAGSGITLSPSNGQATDAKGNGPFPITISSSGGGGGITTINSPLGSIVVTNPTGPTTSLDVRTYPLLQFSSTTNTAYGNLSMNSGSFGGSPAGNTVVGYGAGQVLGGSSTNPQNNTFIGYLAGSTCQQGLRNTCVGSQAGENIAASGSTDNAALGYAAGFATVNGIGNVAIGSNAMASGSTDKNNCVAIGPDVIVKGNGAVAIGVNATGALVATANNDDDFVLGTSDHVVCFLNNHTGTSTITLGSGNAPGSGGAPTTFIKVRLGSGTIGYIPVWT